MRRNATPAEARQVDFLHTTATCTDGSIAINVRQPALLAQISIHSDSHIVITPADSPPRSSQFSQSGDDETIWLLSPSPKDHAPDPKKFATSTFPAKSQPFSGQIAHMRYANIYGGRKFSNNLLFRTPRVHGSDGNGQAPGPTIRLDQTGVEVFSRQDLSKNRETALHKATSRIDDHGMEAPTPAAICSRKSTNRPGSVD